jgi:hypothetical protein
MTGLDHPADTQIKIADIQGRVVRDNRYQADENICVEADLSRGIYLVFLKNGKFSSVKKLVVQ